MGSEEAAEIANDPDANADVGTPPSEDLSKTEAILKKYNALIDDLTTASQSSRWKFGESGSTLDHLHNVGRLIMRMFGPYTTVSQAITVGLAICGASTAENAERRSLALGQCDPETVASYVKIAKWLLMQVPHLEQMIPLFEQDQRGLALFAGFLDYHARQGRTSDIRTLKENIARWIQVVKVPNPSNPGGDPLVFSPLDPQTGTFDQTRANWGWNSAWSARLLIWLSARNQFDAELEECLEGLRNGNIKMDHAGFPSFLYGDLTGPVSDSPQDFLNGLFQGPLLLAGYRCIFTSPESSTKPPGVSGTGRASISRTHHINQVFGENIAYVACLMRHILSSETTWFHQNPQVFDGAAFFQRIVKLFAYEAFATPVLRLFQRHVYGTGPSNPDFPGPPSEFDRLTAYLEAQSRTATEAALPA